jgi:hypothetical protein
MCSTVVPTFVFNLHFILSLQWLLNDFLGYLKDWENEGAQIPGLTRKERTQLCLSRETLEGLRITGNNNSNIFDAIYRAIEFPLNYLY